MEMGLMPGSSVSWWETEQSVAEQWVACPATECFLVTDLQSNYCSHQLHRLPILSGGNFPVQPFLDGVRQALRDLGSPCTR